MGLLVEALCYKPESRGFDCRRCHWNFLLYNPSGRTMTLGSTLPLTEMSIRNISCGSKGGRCIGLTTLLPSFADCLEIWEPQPPRARPGLYRDCFTSYRSFELNFQTFLHFMPCILTDISNNFSGPEFRVKRPKKSLIIVFLIPKLRDNRSSESSATQFIWHNFPEDLSFQ